DMVEFQWAYGANRDSAAPVLDDGIHHLAAVYFEIWRALGYVEPIYLSVVELRGNAAEIAAAVQREEIVARELRQVDVMGLSILASILCLPPQIGAAVGRVPISHVDDLVGLQFVRILQAVRAADRVDQP